MNALMLDAVSMPLSLNWYGGALAVREVTFNVGILMRKSFGAHLSSPMLPWGRTGVALPLPEPTGGHEAS